MILFLDIDGVLDSALPFGYSDGLLCHVERFEAIMRDYPEWQIVISSGWRQRYSLDTLRTFFSMDIAGRIIGLTPIQWLTTPFHRQQEIEQYLEKMSQKSAPWIALDDCATDYFPDSPNLVLCNMASGIDDAVERQLRAKLKSTNQ